MPLIIPFNELNAIRPSIFSREVMFVLFNTRKSEYASRIVFVGELVYIYYE